MIKEGKIIFFDNFVETTSTIEIIKLKNTHKTIIQCLSKLSMQRS